MSSTSSRKAPADGIPREFKPFEEVNVGDVISGPTPGLHTVNFQMNYLHIDTRSTGAASRFHKQIVIGKDMDEKKLEVLVITSIGSMKSGETLRAKYAAQGKDFRRTVGIEDYLAVLEFFVPLFPTPIDPEYQKYNQPPFQVNYADHSVQLSDSISQWVLVASSFLVHGVDIQENPEDLYKYHVLKGMKISEWSIGQLKETVKEKKKKLEAMQLQKVEETNQLTTSNDLSTYVKKGRKHSSKRTPSGRNASQASAKGESSTSGASYAEGSRNLTGELEDLSISGGKGKGKVADVVTGTGTTSNDSSAGQASSVPGPAVSRAPTWSKSHGNSWAKVTTGVQTKGQKVTLGRKKTGDNSQTSGKQNGK